ncbi:PA14 domain-containing protein [Verrucomicrobiota bacterium sgz303538]
MVIRTSTFLAATFLAGAAALAADPQVFTIKTLNAQMRFDTTELTVSPGDDVKIVFVNTDDMPHNMVFFQPGTDVVQASNKQMEKPEEALKRNWLPEDPRVWLHSKMLNPKEKEEIVFKAPEKPGIYPYVCTFPGHAVSMQGRLKVLPQGKGLTDLKFKVYLGDWKKLPDFASLTPHREGAIPDNQIQLKFDDYKNQFGVVYTGKLNAPKDGDYTFAIAGDDGVRLLIDGKKVVEVDGIHPSSELKESKVKLAQGDHDVRVEYFQAAGEADLYVGWRGPEFQTTALSKWLHPNWKGGSVAKKKDDKTGMPLVVGKEPVIYRNFISGAGNRGVGVGYPGGMNVAWNAEQMNLALVWRGAFMDAARHWIDRGGGFQPPLGFDVFRPTGEVSVPFAVLASAQPEWPKAEKGKRPEGYDWKGYQLDANRFPTFFYTWNGVNVSDRIDVQGDAVAGDGKVVRTLKLSGPIPANAVFRAASGEKIEAKDGGFVVDGGRLGLDGREFENRFVIQVDGAQVVGKNLIVPIRPEIRITYSWPFSHNHSAQAHVHAH